MSDGTAGKSSGFSKFFAGKGFYIVLLLCVAVIGAAAWAILFYPSSSNDSVPAGLTVYSGSASEPVRISAETPVSAETAIPYNEYPLSSSDFEDTWSFPERTAEITPEIPDTSARLNTGSADEGAESSSDASPAAAVDSSPYAFVWPVSGKVELPYTETALVYNRTMADWRTHSGIDIAANIGSKVMSVAEGTVEKVYDDDMYGTTVIIAHGGDLQSVYSNLAAAPAVSEGDHVKLGDVIGSIGDTALCENADVTHLHFEMRKNGASVDPFDYLPK